MRASAAAALALLLTSATAHAQAPRPLRIEEAMGSLSWLRLGLVHRSRFEHLEHDFRTTATGASTALSLRTLVAAELVLGPLLAGAELQDSRAYATEGTPLNTGVVDAAELLQAYAGLRLESLLAEGDALALTVGRLTLDVGSRRLVARNEFRNTSNAFTGVDLRWTGPRGHEVRAFAVFPVVRLPSDPAALADNPIELDRENTDALLWGLFASLPVSRLQLETYLLGLREAYAPDVPSADRRLVTAGARLLRPPAPGQLDLELELVLQLGTSRATTQVADVTDLDHRAYAAHLTVGRRLEAAWSPRLALLYDLASGDADPGDTENGRFDPLFGARRFDLGPTGLFGALARSNLSSPGVRVDVAPHRQVDAFVAFRSVWLASPGDAWTAAALRDPSGESGSFVGHQLEARVRWHLLPGNLALELGGAWLARGAFAIDAPAARPGDPLYVYTQVTGTI